ncbi:MAG: ATP-binding cassette domain-containing protein [Verrucomicrobiia bacterium]|jgi:ABC-type transporter Mla maintaining outer membrane lipid asymmetry ATPase subunit MlaF
MDDAAQNANSNAVVIELVGVQISHVDAPEVVVVGDVSWRIGGGDFWVVSGRQASGKSSLLLTAAGMNRPMRGTLQILGKDVAGAHEKDRVDWRRRIGYVFGYSGRLFSHLTVAENIALPLEYHGGRNEGEIVARVNELLTLTELRDYAGHMPSRLSLGVQQRVGLARALSSMPGVEVLFLDNPLSTLSPRECRWWLDFLRQLHENRRAEGKPLTVVASADDFRGWADIADHFAIVGDGHFQVVGGREQLSASAEPVVQGFLVKEF